ncbi:MAG: hypothetical protein QXH91_09725 [Candidatus Bathyarchaeia archaeon]
MKIKNAVEIDGKVAGILEEKYESIPAGSYVEAERLPNGELRLLRSIPRASLLALQLWGRLSRRIFGEELSLSDEDAHDTVHILNDYFAMKIKLGEITKEDIHRAERGYFAQF